MWSSRIETCHAREGNLWSLKGISPPGKYVLNVEKEKGYGGTAGSSHQHAGRSTISTPQGGSSKTFNVLDFGAKGDGNTDDSKVIVSLSFHFYLFLYTETNLYFL